MFGALKNSCIKEFSKIENRVLSSRQLSFGVFIADIPFCPVSSTLIGTIRSKMLFFDSRMSLLMTTGLQRLSRFLRSRRSLGF
jgi:hypothetical protein